jgi:hypothetical protein
MVKRYVDRLFRLYLGKGLAAFGVLNIVALIGIFYSVHQTARDAATVEANRYVDLNLKRYIEDEAKDVLLHDSF